MSVKVVWAENKLHGSKITAVVNIEGPEPKAQQQYRFSCKAEESLSETIHALVNQGMLVSTHSTMNSPIWPVRKPDGKTWRLTADFKQLNKVTNYDAGPSCSQISLSLS